MNRRNKGEWPEVERREKERRDPGPPQHVEIEGISNGARTLLEAFIEETRANRRETQEMRREVNEIRSQAPRWAIGMLTALILGIFGSVWGASAKYANAVRDIEARPTLTVTRDMLDSVRTDVLYGQGVLEILDNHDAVIERLLERSENFRRDIDRIDGEHRRGLP